MPRSALRRVAGFFGELKRRKVYQVTAIYLVLVVGGLELLDLLIPATSLPDWATPLILSLAIMGLPTVVVLAWTFDVTPSGVVRTSDDDRTSEATGRTDPTPLSEGIGAVAELDPLALAVLPFDNMSDSAEAEPFSVGIHDDLITELSRASALTVISRTSVRGYRGTTKSVREIARELHVGTIVEGGVQRSGNRVRLNVQLIDARDDTHRWAERYDRELTAETIFELQSELAARIMEALQAQLTSTEQARTNRRPTGDLEAYRLYTMGREASIDRSQAGLQSAIGLFERALDHDPEYAHAWAGLGMTAVLLVAYGHSDDEAMIDKGRRACLKAVELAPSLAEAHAALGNFHGFRQDAPAALDALEEAKRLGPGLAVGYQRASWIHLMSGSPQAAAGNALRATELAPLEPEARGNLAMAYLAMGHVERSRAEAGRALESHPDFPYPRWVLALGLLADDRVDEALSELWSIHEERYVPWAILVEGLSEQDERAVSERIRELDRRGGPFKAALLEARHGDVDAALDRVRAAWPLFWDDVLVLRYWQAEALPTLRRDARFEKLIEELDGSWGLDPAP